MSNAPYGYRYIRKTDEAPAAYIIDETEARVVRHVYEMYTVEGLSIGEITRQLNREAIPTRKASRWERSVVWALLRNPAYRGLACFGKTRASARTRVMRPQRRRGVTSPSTTAGHERAREEWIEIPVPALVTEASFARAQELLYHNKIRSRRRTIAASVVQGLVSCAKCGYAFSRTSTQTSARKIHYYKCIGSDSWRKLGGPVCAPLQRRLASLNVRKSCACWLKTFWSAKIRLRFVTAFPFPRAHLKTKDRALQKAGITFCVRGVHSRPGSASCGDLSPVNGR